MLMAASSDAVEPAAGLVVPTHAASDGFNFFMYFYNGFV